MGRKKKHETGTPKPNAALSELIQADIRAQTAKRDAAVREAAKVRDGKPTTYTPRFTYDDFEAELANLYPKKQVG